MPKYRGSKNVVLQADGADVPHVECTYAGDGKYETTLTAADAKKYGAALEAEGLELVKDETPDAPAESADD